MISLRRTVSYVTGATLPVSRVYCDNQSVIAQLRKRDLSEGPPLDIEQDA